MKILGAVVLAALLLFVGTSYLQHVKEDARAAAIDEMKHKDEAESKDAEKQALAQLAAELSAIKQQKQLVVEQPAQAPTIIRETIPFSQPIAQTAQITKDTLPDAPVAQLTSRQEQELATFGLTCKECELAKATDEKVIAEKDKQLADKDAEIKAAKGKHPFWRAVSNCAARSAVGGATGGLSGNSKNAAAGASIGLASCLVWRP
jgi:flagellar biosynthesis GTPase FlhF